MPELAEVEYYRKQWNPGIGEPIRSVSVNSQARVFRESDADMIAAQLEGETLNASFAHGKNLLFSFSGGIWIGGHLGMTGRLFSRDKENDGGKETEKGRLHRPGSPKPGGTAKHDHLVITTAHRQLVFQDPRMFGKIVFHTGASEPGWWESLPPQILSRDFSRQSVSHFLDRHPTPPIKALLLNQKIFPGIGNWMADEILWRSKISPLCIARQLDGNSRSKIWSISRQVVRDALRVIGSNWGRPPDTWLFNHRWEDGGICPRPKCHTPLIRETVRGRTTCWCATCQRSPST